MHSYISHVPKIAYSAFLRVKITHTCRFIAGGFDEGAAQVRRLLDRDRKELDFDQLEKSFADPSKPIEPPSSQNTTAKGAQFSANKTPVSPFGPSAVAPSSIKTSGNNPFDVSSPGRSQFMEPSDLSPEPVTPAQPWWTRITLTQIVRCMHILIHLHHNNQFL